jgi:Sec7-like guanine-nucleotide exchange factor
MIGEYLGRDKELSQKINVEFFNLFRFQNIVIDMAFRSIFKKLRLPKESQQIERIIKGFALGYWEDN